MLRAVLFVALVLWPAFAAAERVVVYGAAWCPACRVLVAHLNRRKVEFDYRNVDMELNSQRARQLGSTGKIPFTVIGSRSFIGADLRKVDRELQRAGLLQDAAYPRQEKKARASSGGTKPRASAGGVRSAPRPASRPSSRKGRDPELTDKLRARATLLHRRIAQLEVQVAQMEKGTRLGDADAALSLRRQLEETQGRLASLQRNAERKGVPLSELEP